MFGALLYLCTIVYLLQYVFRPDVMTPDKLFGAAAGYLMLAVFWAYLYRLVGYYDPAAFAVAGQPASLDTFEGLYFSITVLTSTGFGDIAPLSKEARAHGRGDRRDAVCGDPDCPPRRCVFGVSQTAMISVVGAT
jgi:hypothetical protein